jgi:hypothetical protein
MRRRKPILLAAIAACLTLGCAQPAKTVSFKFVAVTVPPTRTTDPSQYQVKQGETVFVDARPIEPLATPSFPAAAPQRGAEPVTIVVKIVVGADGRVDDVQRSLADFSGPTPFARECFEAVKAAVAQWKFEPAELAVVRPQANGRPLIVSSTPTERTFEIAFTFSPNGKASRAGL